jgi:hypothetical protein
MRQESFIMLKYGIILQLLTGFDELEGALVLLKLAAPGAFITGQSG